MGKLVLVRHGQTIWNNEGLWTGFADVELTPKGIEEAKHAGEALKDIHFDQAFSSNFRRSIQTFEVIQETLGQQISLDVNDALDERNYGKYTGKNKWEIEKEVGEEKFQEIRRGWDVKILQGETLKDVYGRAVPFFLDEILPRLKKGENILICAHGNSSRALVKFLEHISDEDIANLNIATGEAYVYDINDKGEVVDKEIRAAHTNQGY